ncbi:putative reverse transcriptase domain-containing protein, partial [Tanacetum coccineum]
TPLEIRSFLGLAGYYQRFIVNFSKIVKPLTSLPQKNQKYEWGVEQEEAFYTLKDNLCNVPIWSLPNGAEDFVVYCNVSNKGLGCVLMQRGKTQYTRKSRVMCNVGKANVVVDELSRKEIVKLRQMRAMSMTIQSSIKDKLLVSQYEVSKEEKAPIEMLCDVRTIIMDAAYATRMDDLRYDYGKLCKSFRNAVGYEYGLSSSNGWPNWDTHLPLAKFSDNNSYHSSIRCAPFEVLYRRKCRSPIVWAEVGENRLISLEMVHESTDNVVLIKERLRATRDRQKGYADNSAVRFEKKGKLAPRCVGPFKILERIGPIAYRLRLPQELSSVHNTIHVSNLKKCLADANLHVPLEEIRVDKTLRFVEEPEEIMDREVKKLKQSRIPIVKVRWNSKRGPEFT